MTKGKSSAADVLIDENRELLLDVDEEEEENERRKLYYFDTEADNSDVHKCNCICVQLVKNLKSFTEKVH